MAWTRALKHLLVPDWTVRRAFPRASIERIERAIAAAETGHSGELRFVVEGGIDFGALLRGQSARERAAEVFARLRVWDTELNTGVLIYVQWVDRRVEILADRGIAAAVEQSQWDAICRALEAAYLRGDYESGSTSAVSAVAALLREHFPRPGRNPNELPDRPVLL